VDYVSPSMDEKTRTLKVRVGVKNPKGRLRAGMFVNVQLFLPSGEDAIVVPKAALLADEGRSFVFVHHHGEYWVRRPVETGRSSGDQVEVTKGLAGGETVVTEGCFLLKSDVLRSKMGAGCAD
jgi:cobalt-zinc-cadmium efflux system membrane fusion protein